MSTTRRLRIAVVVFSVALAAHAAGAANLSIAHPQHPTVQAPVPTAPLADAPAAANPDDPTAELTRLRVEQDKAWQTLNNLNPFSGEYGKTPVQPGAGGPAALTGPMEQLNKLLSQPAVQAYLRFFTNPVFSKGVDQISRSPQRMTLLYAEIGLIVFMLVFRAWRLSKSSHWFKRLWTRLWTLGLFWVSALFLVPWVVLGQPYFDTVSAAVGMALASWK